MDWWEGAKNGALWLWGGMKQGAATANDIHAKKEEESGIKALESSDYSIMTPEQYSSIVAKKIIEEDKASSASQGHSAYTPTNTVVVSADTAAVPVVEETFVGSSGNPEKLLNPQESLQSKMIQGYEDFINWWNKDNSFSIGPMTHSEERYAQMNKNLADEVERQTGVRPTFAQTARYLASRGQHPPNPAPATFSGKGFSPQVNEGQRWYESKDNDRWAPFPNISVDENIIIGNTMTEEEKRTAGEDYQKIKSRGALAYVDGVLTEVGKFQKDWGERGPEIAKKNFEFRQKQQQVLKEISEKYDLDLSAVDYHQPVEIYTPEKRPDGKEWVTGNEIFNVSINEVAPWQRDYIYLKNNGEKLLEEHDLPYRDVPGMQLQYAANRAGKATPAVMEEAAWLLVPEIKVGKAALKSIQIAHEAGRPLAAGVLKLIKKEAGIFKSLEGLLNSSASEVVKNKTVAILRRNYQEVNQELVEAMKKMGLLSDSSFAFAGGGSQKRVLRPVGQVEKPGATKAFFSHSDDVRKGEYFSGEKSLSEGKKVATTNIAEKNIAEPIGLQGSQHPQYGRVKKEKSSWEKPLFVKELIEDPYKLVGKTRIEVKDLLGKGWAENTYGSAGKGWKFTKGDIGISFHPGDGRHKGSYYIFSTAEGRKKIVYDGYFPSEDDTAEILYIRDIFINNSKKK